MKKRYSKYSDQELVDLMKGSKRQSEAAFTEIYDRYALRINAYCRSILNNREHAEDVFQETFLKFYQNAQSGRKQGSIIGFLITISRNLCLNAKRNKKNNVPIEDIEYLLHDTQNYEDKELPDLVMFAIELLDADQKEVLILRIFDDLSYKEIGEILEITDSRARYLAFVGKQKVKDTLQPYLKDYIK